MSEKTLMKLIGIWSNPWWYVAICIGFLVNATFSVGTPYLADSITKWAVGIIVSSIFLAVCLAIADKDDNSKWRVT